MGNDRIMQQVRELLFQGKSSGEVIQLGYAPGTVYKVQRQLRLEREKLGEPTPLVDQDQSISDEEDSEELSAEDAEFLRLLFGPVDVPDPETCLRAELEQARGRIEELEQEAGQVQALQERVRTLEAEFEAGVALRLRIQYLEHQLKNAEHTQEALHQNNLEWQTRFQAEQLARQQAELRTEEYRDLISQWQRECQLLQAKLDTSTQNIADLRAEIQRLEPLKVWAGHPCSVCHKPMSGSVGRELAAELQKGLAHRACLQKQGGGIGKLLVAGVSLYGLSKLSK